MKFGGLDSLNRVLSVFLLASFYSKAGRHFIAEKECKNQPIRGLEHPIVTWICELVGMKIQQVTLIAAQMENIHGRL